MKTSTIAENRVLRGWGNYFQTGTLPPLTLLQLQRSELPEAARLLGRGMCDNPANIRAFGIPDAERRSQALVRLFGPVLCGLYQRGLIRGAFREVTLVGVCGMVRSGLCQPSALEKLRVVPSVAFGNPVGTSLWVLRWVGEWVRRDPAEPHWHLGPVAVDSHLHGQGIGGAMLVDLCARMDDERALAYLETDKSENVRFYQKFGFPVIAEAEILGIPNWFMSRSPRISSQDSVNQADGGVLLSIRFFARREEKQIPRYARDDCHSVAERSGAKNLLLVAASWPRCEKIPQEPHKTKTRRHRKKEKDFGSKRPGTNVIQQPGHFGDKVEH